MLAPRKTSAALLIKSLLVCLIIPFSSCEKYHIKRHYTGEFEFTSYNADCYGGGYEWCTYDTIKTKGTIEWVDDKVLLITVGVERYAVDCDFEGQLSLHDYVVAKGSGRGLNGRFENHDKLFFSYGQYTYFMGNSSRSARKVYGTRL